MKLEELKEMSAALRKRDWGINAAECLIKESSPMRLVRLG
jgi:hypothetical protein